MENNQTDKEWNEYRQRTSEGWFQLQPEHKREIEKQLTDKMREQINTQTNKTWWTETKLWTISSIVTAVILLSAIYFTKTLLIICLTSLVGIFLGLLVAGIYVIIKAIFGLDDK